MSPATARPRASAALCAGVLILAGCSAGTVTPEEFQQATGQQAPSPTEAPEPERVTSDGGEEGASPRITESTSVPAVTPGEVGFGDGAAAIDAVAGRAGSAELSLQQVVLYPGYAIVSAVVPSRPGEVDRYTVRRTRIDGPDPVRVTTLRGDLGSTLFGPAEIPWAAVPGFVETTKASLGIPGAEVTHVIVERNLPFSPEIVLRVYADSGRASGRVEFAPDGRQLRTFKD